MTDNPSPNRKTCPTCGHLNRAEAKVCSQCGHTFAPPRLASSLRKTCPVCGHENRLRAQVCSNCGTPFEGARPVKTSILTLPQKWCPQCGAPRRPGAKVCPQCGFHFRTNRLTAPIVQQPPPAVVLPPDKKAPPVDLPTDIGGEPAPFISSEELDRLRGGGVYHPNVFIRLLSHVSKKNP